MGLESENVLVHNVESKEERAMNKLRFIVLAVFFTAVAVGSGFAQDEPAKTSPFTCGAESDFNSRYIWRGLAWSRGASWQPGVWVGTSGFLFNAWASLPLGDEPNQYQFNEIDLRLSYAKEWGNFTLASAFNIYSYPNQDKTENPTTGELELAASCTFSSWTLLTTHYLDLIDNPGGYVGEMALEFEKKAAKNLLLNAAARLLFANAKFNDYYVPLKKAAVDTAVLEIRLTYNLSSAIYVAPHFAWSMLLDSEIKDAVAKSPWVFSDKPMLTSFGIAVGIEL